MIFKPTQFKYRVIFKVIRVEFNIFKTKHISQHIFEQCH